MWEALEVYKEFVINGLDLVSFLFVTPELLRLFAPTVRNVPTIVMFGLFGGFLAIVVPLFWSHMTSFDLKIFFGRWILYCVYAFVIIAFAAIPLAVKIGERGQEFFSRHGFVLGVLLFLLLGYLLLLWLVISCSPHRNRLRYTV